MSCTRPVQRRETMAVQKALEEAQLSPGDRAMRRVN